MDLIRKFILFVLFSLILIASVGYGSDAAMDSPFLDEKKFLFGGLEWNREIVSKTGGSVFFRVSSQGPMSITIITDNGYKAAKNPEKYKFRREDMLFTIDTEQEVFETSIDVPAGSSWFIIGNRTNKIVEIHLQCYKDNGARNIK